jgi:hypothetical protein
MNAGDELARIERQLQDQADRLLWLHGYEPPTSALLAEHRSRRRRRIVGAVCGVAMVLMLVGAAGVLRSIPQEEPLANQREASDDARPAVPSHAPGHDSSPVVVSPQVAPGDARLDRAPQFVAHPASGSDGPPAWPVLITVPEGDKERVIATGIYVPEHTRPLDLLDLPPAEQHAVRQVLGIPQPSISRDPI